MFRKLRIAFSILCGIVCLLLVALWVRSYWARDRLTRHYETSLDFQSSRGGFAFALDFDHYKRSSSPSPLDRTPWGWKFTTHAPHAESGEFEFWCDHIEEEYAIVVPHWFLVVACATCGIVPWIQWSKRFSLRTLLIATTLVAVFLGAIVYAVR